jgi:anthranilate synthase component 2
MSLSTLKPDALSNALPDSLPDTLPDIVMIDNLDSFTYNLVDEFRCLGYQLTIYRNTLSADFIFQKLQEKQSENPAGVILVLSPGPGTPANAGCLMALIKLAVGQFPMLGICLGHQALIEHYGGHVGRAPEIVHGKASNITHTERDEFSGIQQSLPVARYHSLVGLKMPEALETTAYLFTDNGEKLPMAIAHKQDNIIAFQFHPESILTTFGSTLLAQSIDCLSPSQCKVINNARNKAQSKD